ncbi:MAG: DUF2071 domain-containing protein [Bacteroidetes bacterium]|jgi:uncharacterized protein YqjF (DUF2071 family)|nr:DUF2071 domain-containing protein [Bacteroidota bacterium]
MRFPFLTAHWSNIALVTYAVPPDRVTPHLPPGVVADRREGRAFVSLVAFDFRDLRVLGVPVPGGQRFPEVNLRLYARQGDREGVVFAREMVPSRLVAGAARLLYNEPYARTSLQVEQETSGNALAMTYRFGWKGREQRVRVTGRTPAAVPAPNSTAHFFKERHWGFGTTHNGRTLRYRVEHPRWAVYPVAEHHVTLDWAHVFGPDWAFLQEAKPYSVLLAKGSPVTVYWRESL